MSTARRATRPSLRRGLQGIPRIVPIIVAAVSGIGWPAGEQVPAQSRIERKVDRPLTEPHL
jgi:hypothetical protein